MSKKSNIQLFDEITARIFFELYTSFPIPLDIECREMTGGKELDDDGNIPHDIEVCGAALSWLQNEGFIKFLSNEQFSAYEVVLTSKGLRAMKSTPEALEGRKTVGDRLETAMKNGSVSTAIEVIKLIFA